MGYRFPEETATLVFEGTKYKGAEVKVRLSVPMQVFLEARKASEDWESYLPYFIKEVVCGWNLEYTDGRPIPVTGEGALSIPGGIDFLMRLVTEWAGQVGNVPAPLGSGSSNGRPSVEASLPTASL